ncbi:NAD(P)/FAD-dependent oxidoreductase [Roseiconus lacunae]|uniref:NAD(P)/FAD-dependent oxidoreductase n=1 Tax=Roseiconus lacunae TaxID=2605694 RepID=UPI001E506FFF|nr:FAD-dependent oxidoreductase [Roseiconus lacunae]MCD0460208.1 FAD-dependent oxidoreductase [Roseiconus lacunae]
MTFSGSQSVLVIGGGIIGVSCAHYLSEAGYSVTVIDRSRIGSGCSHANCGYICPSHVLPLTEPGAIGIALKSLFNRNAPFRIQPRFSPALFRWMAEFARRCRHRPMIEAGKHLQAILESSMHEYRRLVSEHVIDGQWKNNGLLYVFQTDAAFAKFQHACDLIRENFGVEAKTLAGDVLPTFDPALRRGLAGACYYPDDSSVRPDQLLSQWVDRLRERGVRFVESCELRSLRRERGRGRGAMTTDGDYAADHYVIATGAWSPKLSQTLGCHLPIEPGKGYSVTMSRPNPCPTHPMLFPEHKVGVTPFDDGYRLGSMMEFVGYDSSIPPRRIEQLKRSAEPYLIQPHTPEIRETWYGWRPMTWDSLPIIGRVPGLDNVFLATGHNMLGVSLATATGRLISELVSEEKPHLDIHAFSPSRF